MTIEIVSAARRHLATAGGEAALAEVASRAVRLCEQLVRHLSQLVGGTGIRTLLDRSVRLASASYPWLGSASTGSDGPAAALHICLVSQPADVATEGFVLVLSTLVGLLVKLIGEGLVTRVLHELWSTMFPEEVRRST